MSSHAHMARAIEQISDKQPVPEIDYTMHRLDDGTIISTQERVIKDVRVLSFLRNAFVFKNAD